MKGYSRLETAQAAARRLIAQGVPVVIDVRNGWYVLQALPELPRLTIPPNDNTPPDDRSEA